ncbi:MAG: aspartate/glutamate racemase family protein [Chthoniobacterales bacterium]
MAISTMPTIGVAGVTMPGVLDCIHKIHQECLPHFPAHQHPNIILDQPNFGPKYEAQKRDDWNSVEDLMVASINQLAASGADFVIIPANTINKVIRAF